MHDRCLSDLPQWPAIAASFLCILHCKGQSIRLIYAAKSWSLLSSICCKGPQHPSTAESRAADVPQLCCMLLCVG
eukprot:151074-Chlamydomonas_euryale.AAC.1